MSDGFRKCFYQLDDCQNWSNEGLTLGTSYAWMGPKDSDGRSTLVEVDAPICRACLDAKPEPHDPGPYYGSPDTNPDAVPIAVPRYVGG